MRYQGTAWIAIALFAATAATVPVASAQLDAQSVNVQIQEEQVTRVPDELPGVYKVDLVVETTVTTGQCACTETSITLDTVNAPSGVYATLSPSSFVVDWTQQPGPQYHAHEVEATFGVPETYQNASMIAVSVHGDADSNPDYLVEDRVHHAEIALPIPHEPSEESAAEDDEEDANATTTGEPDGSEANTHAGASAPGSGLDGAALGTGAAAASLAMVGLAVRRWRG